MKSVTELAGGGLCLPQRSHNQVGAARRRRMNMHELFSKLYDLHRENISCIKDIEAIPPWSMITSTQCMVCRIRTFKTIILYYTNNLTYARLYI